MAENTGVLVIGSDAVLTGEVKGARKVEVYGVLEGGVQAGDVTVRQGGKLTGKVRSDTSTVEGDMQGDVRVQQLITIRATGAVSGTVHYGRLAMEEGAELAASVRNVPPSIGGDLDLAVGRGKSVRITPADLSAIDPDDAPSELMFRASNVIGGTLTDTRAPGIAIETFTQADLLAGRVLFAHDGGDAPTGRFDVIVSDAAGATSGTAQTVRVAIRA